MSSFEKNSLMNSLWNMVTGHSVNDPIGKVCDEVLLWLKDSGYRPEVLNKGRGYRTIRVEDVKYRIVRYRAGYDLVMVKEEE